MNSALLKELRQRQLQRAKQDKRKRDPPTAENTEDEDDEHETSNEQPKRAKTTITVTAPTESVEIGDNVQNEHSDEEEEVDDAQTVNRGVAEDAENMPGDEPVNGRRSFRQRMIHMMKKEIETYRQAQIKFEKKYCERKKQITQACEKKLKELDEEHNKHQTLPILIQHAKKMLSYWRTHITDAVDIDDASITTHGTNNHP